MLQRIFVMVLFSAALCASSFSEDRADRLDSLINQALIFRTYDCSDHVKVKWTDIRKRMGGYDPVFTIHRIDKKKDRVEFILENIGTLTIRGRIGNGLCRMVLNPVKLTISNIPPSTSEADLVASVRSLLMDADSYLEFKGYVSGQSNLPVGTDPATNLDSSMPSVLPPPALLTAFPRFPDDMKRKRVGGAIHVAVVIGRDGRIYSPRITKSPAEEFNTEVLRILPLCRYEPVLKDGKPIAAQTVITWIFNIK